MIAEAFVAEKLFLMIYAGFGGSVDAAGILDFVDSGRDLIIAADFGMSDTIRDIANECGVEFDEVCSSGFATLSD